MICIGLGLCVIKFRNIILGFSLLAAGQKIYHDWTKNVLGVNLRVAILECNEVPRKYVSANAVQCS